MNINIRLKAISRKLKEPEDFPPALPCSWVTVKTLEPVEESVAHSAPKTLSKGSCS
ncbi:MAG: hypothetical protein J6N70_06985 [Oribacterium sp.]|nr:hypothetical protein [Oribacterium sp.]